MSGQNNSYFVSLVELAIEKRTLGIQNVIGQNFLNSEDYLMLQMAQGSNFENNPCCIKVIHGFTLPLKVNK